MEAAFSLCKKFPNQDLLGFAASSFFVFVVVEMIAAFVSGSLSLLADSIAMTVDVVTYVCNMVAERVKERDGLNSSFGIRFVMLICIPLFAVTTLVFVTSYFIYEAMKVLKQPTPEVDSVSVVYLYGFAGVNLVVDIFCICMFYFRGKDVFYERRRDMLPQLSLDTSIHSDDSDEFGTLDDDFYAPDSPGRQDDHKDDDRRGGDDVRYLDREEDIDRKRNLNMMSAFAHLGGDTFRTLSVLGAAVAASITGASVDKCDAWGAIVVAGLVLLLMIPLVIDIIKSLQDLLRENRDYGLVADEEMDDIVI